MMTVREQLQQTVVSNMYGALEQNKKPLDVVTGIGVAILCSHVPFILSFTIARSGGFSALNYPAVEPTAAAAGLAICILSLPIALEMKQRSLPAIMASSAVIFWILGLLAAFTV